MKKGLVFCAIAMAMFSAVAALPKMMSITPKGVVNIGEFQLTMQCSDSSWRSFPNNKWENIKKDGNKYVADVNISGSKAKINYSLNPTDSGAIDVDFQMNFSSATELKSLYANINVPVKSNIVFVDGKKIELPLAFDKITPYSNMKAKTVSLKLSDGSLLTFTGSTLKFIIQDNRNFNKNTFSFRFLATPDKGEVKSANLKMNVAVIGIEQQVVDITKSVNFSFVDEIAGDKKGGWTDQGSTNDLRLLTAKKVSIGSLNFDIVDPAKNSQKSTMILAGEERSFADKELTLAVPENNMQAINLLHAAAWVPKLGEELGKMEVTYSDNSQETIALKARVDCGNWWEPANLPNSFVAWRGENPESTVGLYATSFALSKKNPRSIKFVISDPNAMWMIAGVTLSSSKITLQEDDNAPIVIKAGKEWKKLDYTRKIVAGSPLDFSNYLDAPAGKYGYVIANNNGHLAFEKAPNKRLKLYGVNLCYGSNFITKEAADELADYLAKCGYNSVRFHHHDSIMLDNKAENSLTLNPKEMDKFDYLFYALKRRGMYITTDLYSSRKFKVGDNIEECDFYNQTQMKSLLALSRGTMENWKAFAKLFMNHVNPYTKMSWGEDPALYCVNLVNEDTLTHFWSQSPKAVKRYEKAFSEWCAKNGVKGKTNTSNPAFRKFLHEIQEAVLEEQIAFIKDELKLKTLVTSLNFVNDAPLTLLREKFDVVDDHAYFDHPKFVEKSWNLPYRHHQESAVERMAQVPNVMMPSRIPGKPFLVTEINYCNPNIYRAEGAALIGAYSALQSWDAIYRFSWGHNAQNSIYNISAADRFDAANDPMSQLSDRVSMAMFVRGDVKEATMGYSYEVSPNIFDNYAGGYPSAFGKLGLICAIGSSPKGYKLPSNFTELTHGESTQFSKVDNAKIAELWKNAVKNNLATSITGEIELNGNKCTMKVVTPKSESITLGAGGELVAGLLKVRNSSVWQSISALALDNKPLAESSSILIVHLTNIANTNQAFKGKTILTAWGKLPLLIQKGTADVEFNLGHKYKVEALKCDGSVYGEVKSSFQNGVLNFSIDTTMFEGGVMAYHLSR